MEILYENLLAFQWQDIVMILLGCLLIFLAIKKDRTDDWCFEVKDGIIVQEKVGGEDCWQMVGISYWSEADGHRLSQDIADVYAMPGGKERYWEQVPLVYRKANYSVAVMECFD